MATQLTTLKQTFFFFFLTYWAFVGPLCSTSNFKNITNMYKHLPETHQKSLYLGGIARSFQAENEHDKQEYKMPFHFFQQFWKN